MAKTISFTYKDKEYTLEFTRRSIEQMEREGFRATEITEKPMSMLPTLFAGAFKAHHPFVSKADVNDIFDTVKNKQDLIGRLAEMYNEPIEALMAEPEESASGNVEWTASW